MKKFIFRKRDWKNITLKELIIKIIGCFGIEIKRIYPKPFEEFALKGNNLVGVEVGVYEGDHAKSMLKTGKVDKLYLIDSYKYIENRKDVILKNLEEAKLKAYNLLKRENVEWIYLFSNEAVNKIPNNLDFVYLDGGHSYKTIKEDIDNYWKKIKVGGILGGDDIYNGENGDRDGVVRAVIEFAVKNNFKLKIESPDWWIIKQRNKRYFKKVKDK